MDLDDAATDQDPLDQEAQQRLAAGVVQAVEALGGALGRGVYEQGGAHEGIEREHGLAGNLAAYRGRPCGNCVGGSPVEPVSLASSPSGGRCRSAPT